MSQKNAAPHRAPQPRLRLSRPVAGPSVPLRSLCSAHELKRAGVFFFPRANTGCFYTFEKTRMFALLREVATDVVLGELGGCLSGTHVEMLIGRQSLVVQGRGLGLVFLHFFALAQDPDLRRKQKLCGLLLLNRLAYKHQKT